MGFGYNMTIMLVNIVTREEDNNPDKNINTKFYMFIDRREFFCTSKCTQVTKQISIENYSQRLIENVNRKEQKDLMDETKIGNLQRRQTI